MARFLIRRWQLSDEVALFIGTAIVVVLVITLVNGVLLRGFLAGANRVFQPQNTTTRDGVVQPQAAREVRQPRVFRPLGHPGLSGPQLRRHRPARRRADPDQRQARQGTDPGVRRPADRRHRRRPDGGAAQRTRAHRRLRPQGARHRPDHRHRVGQPDRRPVAGDDVQRRHRDRRIAVFVSAELDLVPRRPAEVDGVRPDDDRRRPRPVGAAAARPAPQAAALRREPRLDGGPGRVRLAARHLPDGLLLGAVGGTAQRQPAVAARSRCAATRAPPRSNRATTTAARCGSPRATTPPRSPRDTAPPWDGTRVLFLQHASDPIVWWSPGPAVHPAGLADRTAGRATGRRRCGGIRSSRSGRSPPT